MFNDEGVRYIHERTRPLAVDSIDEAAKQIDVAIKKGLDRRVPVNFSDADERLAYARHLAWIIGFDALIDDRKAINKITSLIVK